MIILMCCYEMANLLFGGNWYHPQKALVKNVDISAQYRLRKRRV